MNLTTYWCSLLAVEVRFALVAVPWAALLQRCGRKSRRSKKEKVMPCQWIFSTQRNSSCQSCEHLSWCQLWIRSLWDSNVAPLGIQCKQYKEDDFKCSNAQWDQLPPPLPSLCHTPAQTHGHTQLRKHTDTRIDTCKHFVAFSIYVICQSNTGQFTAVSC